MPSPIMMCGWESKMGALSACTRTLRRFFISLNTASSFLLAVIILAIIAGFLPQFPREWAQAPESAKWWWGNVKERYGFYFTPLNFLGFFNAFYSPLFLGLMLLILASALICTLNRLLPLLRRPRPGRRFITSPDFYETGPYTATLPAEGATHLINALKKRGYHVLTGRVGEQTCFFAERNRWSRLTSPVSHLSLLLVAIGFILSLIWRSWQVTPPLTPGTSLNVGRGVTLTLEEFKVKRSPDGVPVDYRSSVKVNGRAALLRLGHPLGVKGFLLLFNSYGPAWSVEARTAEGEPVSLEVEGEEYRGKAALPFPVQGQVRELKLPEEGIILEASVQPKGLFVRASKGGKSLFEGFAKPEKTYRLEGMEFRFTPTYYVTYKLVKDPGFPIAIAGGLIFVAASFLTFAFSPRRIWGLVDGETCKVKGDRTLSLREWQRIVKAER
ncbi:MAG: hypothetical protein DRI61_02970 [Chloroflexi bacterium]|nr:MAG: hypothetical protein DRI61_02970 [Chloroflexota bacterium]